MWNASSHGVLHPTRALDGPRLASQPARQVSCEQRRCTLRRFACYQAPEAASKAINIPCPQVGQLGPVRYGSRLTGQGQDTAIPRLCCFERAPANFLPCLDFA